MSGQGYRPGFERRNRVGCQLLAKWRADGDLKCPEDIVEGGVGAFPDTLLKLFSGENFGKLMIKVAD